MSDVRDAAVQEAKKANRPAPQPYPYAASDFTVERA